MAHISHIWFHKDDLAKKEMQVVVELKPAGRVDLQVKLPVKFYDAVMQCAQTAADAHEALMKAEILSDNPTRDSDA